MEAYCLFRCRGGHPPGRPRVAISSTPSGTAPASTWRSSCGAAASCPCGLAVALRGDRGSQLRRPNPGLSEAGWRSPSGAAEDRNWDQLLARCSVPGAWRSLSGDRRSQHPRLHGWRGADRWRSPSRRRCLQLPRGHPGPNQHHGVAVVLRGNRGSQHRGRLHEHRAGGRWCPPFGAAEDRECETNGMCMSEFLSGGHPLGRPWIATGTGPRVVRAFPQCGGRPVG